MKTFFAFLFCLFFAAYSLAFTTVSGDVSGQTWSSGTYYVTGNLTVNDNTTLTIQPGVVVKFASSIVMIVYGTIDAAGTSGSNIYFTSKNDNTIGETVDGSSGSPAAGDWYGIYVDGNGTNDGIANFDYCTIKYGGGSGSYQGNIAFYYSNAGTLTNSTSSYSLRNGIYITSSSPTINQNTISNNSLDGIYSNGVAPIITNNTFNNNSGYAANLTNTTTTAYSGNTGSGNGINGIKVIGTVTTNQTWTMGNNMPFILGGTVTINDGITLTLSENTIIKGETAGVLYCYGTLSAVATSGNEIKFTSIKDDNYGGDTNGDAAGSTPAAGDWYGVYVDGNGIYDGIANFDYCTIKYGGGSSGYPANISFYYSEAGTLTNSTSSYSIRYGVYSLGCSPTINNNTISNNTLDGIYANSSSPIITNNNLNDNIEYAANLNSITTTAYSGNTGSGNGINGIKVIGTVTTNQTWTMGNNMPFILGGTVTINDGITLTLSENTIIKGETAGVLYCYGTLSAVATSGNEIKFTSIKDDNYGGDTNGDAAGSTPAAGDWYGVYVDGNGIYDGIANFDYCTIKYGGGSSGYPANISFYYSEAGTLTNSTSSYSIRYGVYSLGCSPTINNNTISNNTLDGIYANSSSPIITNNNLNDNIEYAANLNSITTTAYSGNTGSGNGINGIKVIGTVTTNQTWTMGNNMPFILGGTVTINDGITLTLSENTIIKGETAGVLYCYGTLSAVATSGNEIKFTSIKDDNYGGDTNGDAAGSTPAAGDWYGVYVDGNGIYDGIANFDYCTIKYGGGSSGYPANISFYYSEAGTLTNSTSSYSIRYGVYSLGCSPTINNNTISNNTLDGIYATSSTPIITNNNLNDNSGYGAYIVSSTWTSYSGNSGSGNGTNSFAFASCQPTSNDITWSSTDLSFPFHLLTNHTINSPGTLTISSGSLKLPSPYYLTGTGNFALNSGATIEIGSLISSNGAAGNIQNSGSRIFSTGANYIYNGASAQNTGSGLPSQVNDLKIDNSTGVSLTAPTTINGILYLSNGEFENNPVNVTLANGKTISINSGTFSVAPIFGPAINVEYTGSTQVTTGYEIPSSDIINNLTVNKSGGIILNQNAKVNGTLTLTSGNITTGANTLTLGSSTSNLGLLTPGTGKIVGNFKRWFAASTISDVLFPVGTTGNYRPASVSFTTAPGTGGTITSFFTATNPGTNGLPLNDGGISLTNVSPDGYWTLQTGDGLTGGIYTLDLSADAFSGVDDFSKLHLIKRGNSGSAWALEGTHSACTGSNACPIIHRADLNTFSEFGVASTSDNPLPVELLSFNANNIFNQVKLNWKTATEIDNYGFEIERKQFSVGSLQPLGGIWENIGFVNGHGNSNSPKEYTFIDENPGSGKFEYRLKQMDNNGNFGYSAAIEVEINQLPTEFKLYQNYPNPFNPSTTIKYSIPFVETRGGASIQNILLKIYDVLGNEIATLVNENKAAGVYEVEFNASMLPSGIYFYRLRAGDYDMVKKLILMK